MNPKKGTFAYLWPHRGHRKYRSCQYAGKLTAKPSTAIGRNTTNATMGWPRLLDAANARTATTQAGRPHTVSRLARSRLSQCAAYASSAPFAVRYGPAGFALSPLTPCPRTGNYCQRALSSGCQQALQNRSPCQGWHQRERTLRELPLRASRSATLD